MEAEDRGMISSVVATRASDTIHNVTPDGLGWGARWPVLSPSRIRRVQIDIFRFAVARD